MFRSRDTFSDRYREDNGVLCGAVIKTRGRVEREGDEKEKEIGRGVRKGERWREKREMEGRSAFSELAED